MGTVTPPILFCPDHDTSDFDSGNETLNEWLIKRAWKNQENGASRTFVICDNTRVIGYYALATGSIERGLATNNFSRGMPDPIPVIIIARLAIDLTYQGQRLGSALLKDAILRTLAVAKNVGVRGILVHAISEEAKKFYLNYGFQTSPFDPMTLLLSAKHLNKIITSSQY